MAEESGLVDRHQEEEAETRSSTSSLPFASDAPYVDGVGTLFTDLSDDDEEGYNDEIEISGDDSWKVEPYAPHVVGSERKTPPPTPRLPSTQKLPWLPKSKHDELQRYKTDAVIKLLGILIEDADCAKLFWLAVTDGSIERENLEVRVRSMIIMLAADLAEEADKHAERIMPSFASENAETFAWALIELAQAAPKIPEPYHSETKKEKDNNDAAHTESLELFRVFVIRSSALQRFRGRLEAFVLPKDLRSYAVESTMDIVSISTPASNRRHRLVLVRRMLQPTLVVTGVLEPLFRPGMFRLRWQCKCGDILSDDVREYREGGVAKLVEQMQRSTGSEVTGTSYEEASSNPKYFPGLANRFRAAAKNSVSAFSKAFHRGDILPRHIGGKTTASPETMNIDLSSVPDLLLLGCVHKSHGGKGLRQDQIGAIENDCQLFRFIHQQLSRTRRVRWSSLPIKTITGIHFSKFHLRLNNDVEPRLHKPCCRQDACQCIPLASNREYKCNPSGPLDFGLPVLPQQMLHYFNHPLLISEREKSILNQLPKRMCGELQANGQVPAEGWGLYYEESWNISLVIIVTVVVTTFTSLLFGIYWTLKKFDIQGAWGLSSYMITTCALVVALLSIIGRGKSE